MPRRGDPLAVADTSVAAAAILWTHVDHDRCARAIRDHRAAIAGHALFETYSVLTRLPGDARMPPGAVRQALDHDFPQRIWLAAKEFEALLTVFADGALVGGAVYDALIGACSKVSGLPLLTRDSRAKPTYDRLGITTIFVSGHGTSPSE